MITQSRNVGMKCLGIVSVLYFQHRDVAFLLVSDKDCACHSACIGTT